MNWETIDIILIGSLCFLTGLTVGFKIAWLIKEGGER
jgi:hypothetical protein